MCGQCGVIFGQKRRTQRELNSLTSVFTQLLLYNESRGRDASGMYISNKDSSSRVLKHATSASRLTQSPEYQRMMNGVNNHSAAALGHTRWRTVGSESVAVNNHPIITDRCVGTHNGTILNHNALFARHGWKRIGQVDSEALFRLADSCISDGGFDMEQFADSLCDFEGTMSFVLINRLEPDSIYVGVGNMPIAFLYHKVYRCIIYSSEAAPLIKATATMGGWQSLQLASMRIYRFNISDLTEWQSVPFLFQQHIRNGRV